MSHYTVLIYFVTIQGYSASAGHSAGVASLAGVQEKTAIQDTSAQKSSNIALIISSLTRDDSNVDAVNAIDPSDPKLSVLQQAITVSFYESTEII